MSFEGWAPIPRTREKDSDAPIFYYYSVPQSRATLWRSSPFSIQILAANKTTAACRPCAATHERLERASLLSRTRATLALMQPPLAGLGTEERRTAAGVGEEEGGQQISSDEKRRRVSVRRRGGSASDLEDLCGEDKRECQPPRRR